MQASFPDARILIVDDEPDLAELFAEFLATAGYRAVRTLTDARQFSSVFIEYAPDAVLLDLAMPAVSGFEILGWIRELVNAGDRIPVLVLTGDATAETKRRALAAGASDFLTKPPDYDETLLRIGNLVETRMLHKRLQSQNAALEITVNARTRELRLALEDLAHANAELRASQEETVRRLAAAAEFRDGETAMHLHRIGAYAESLARAAGVPEDGAGLLRLAAPMHDIGKICVPDNVLMKRTLLTPPEFEVMKQHADIGYRILEGSSSPLLRAASVVAWTHHERWDGSGYPRGLAHDEIPLEGRIVAVVDAFDSMTSARRYKDAIPQERACELLSDGAGTHFDPDLVAAFLDVVPVSTVIDLN